jgi:hypothetical protein
MRFARLWAKIKPTTPGTAAWVRVESSAYADGAYIALPDMTTPHAHLTRGETLELIRALQNTIDPQV